MFRLYSSIAFISLSLSLFAQQKKEEAKADTVENKFLPTGIRIGTDAFSVARNFYDKTFQGWEVNADVDFYRYYLAVDVGSWSRDFDSESGAYHNQGNYFRIGADVNFLLKDPDRNLMFFGVRYGNSKFSETYNEVATSPIYGTNVVNHSNPDVNAHWYELTAGIRVKMWKFFWMGYTGRFKFGLSTNETGNMIPSDVPGYGRTDRDQTWGFNYQLIFRIPIRKVPSGPLKQ
jgi:hypothetical protein